MRHAIAVLGHSGAGKISTVPQNEAHFFYEHPAVLRSHTVSVELVVASALQHSRMNVSVFIFYMNILRVYPGVAFFLVHWMVLLWTKYSGAAYTRRCRLRDSEAGTHYPVNAALL